MDLRWITPWLLPTVDLTLVLALTYLLLLLVGEGRALWMVRGFVLLTFATALSRELGLRVLPFLLERLLLGATVVMAVFFQADLRRFLEKIGRGNFGQIFQPARRAKPSPDTVIDEIIEAVRELSQRRIGALIVIEADEPIDEGQIPVPGVNLNAEVSKELLQTIFQPATLLHDGAVLISQARIISAGMILPLSQRSTSRQLGTRHRAAMGVTELIPDCLCIVVSEETGAISLAEKGLLDRPLTCNRLREILLDRLVNPTKK